MNVAFFCSKPYQILLAINMKNFMTDCVADIYIINHFEKSKDVALRLQEIDIFKQCYWIGKKHQYSSHSFIRHFQKFCELLTYKKQLKRNNIELNKKYERIYLTYPDTVIQYALIHYYTQNSELTVHIYEDGTGGYSDKIFNSSIQKKLLSIIVPRYGILDKYNEMLINNPLLYKGDISIPINKLPVFCTDSQVLKKLNYLFEFDSDTDIISEKIIFLEQPLDFYKGLNEEISETVKVIYENVNKNDFIVKLHPGSVTNTYQKYRIYSKSMIPWEIITLNMNMNYKVLISYFSTAVFTPKIIFNFEPVIILLYDLIEFVDLGVATTDYANLTAGIKKSYKDSNRVFIPKDISELLGFLNNDLLSLFK